MPTLPKKLACWLTASGFTKDKALGIYHWSQTRHQKPIYTLQHSGADLMIIRSLSTRRTYKPGIRWIATVPLTMPTRAIIDLLSSLTAHETQF